MIANNGANEGTQLTELELYATPGVNTINGIHATEQFVRNESVPLAFDHDPATKWVTSSTVEWLQYEFRAVTAPVEGYTIVSANDVPERDPRSWVLLANNTGQDANEASDSEWTVLDSQTNQGPFPERNHPYSYAIANPGAFKFYRLKISTNNGAPSLQLSEIELLAR